MAKRFLQFSVAILLFSPVYASAQAGQLDPTFANGGILRLRLASR
jgi:hypothetical protein